ncbi:hypothetical protein [Streptomyces sp. NPDC048639]|uniref:hypothetical protein n=1 Tax=Streptomyces sp. NPDC048639 TaxID=3365581 RepID=UPI003718C8ED
MHAMHDGERLGPARSWLNSGRPAPPGWPGDVPPPSSSRFEQGAKDWLFGLAPDRWIGQTVLHQYPVVLARMVRHHLQATLATAFFCSLAEDELSTGVASHPAAEAVAISRHEAERAVTLGHQVRLVEEALRTTR